MGRRIIAIFGPSGANSHEVAAWQLGNAVGRDDILLTGGSGIVDASVKEQAIAGADDAIDAGGSGRWIGIPRAGQPVRKRADGRSYIVRHQYQHERNYVGASICDVGIGLRGGPGTDSEIAFCLALGKPVVLVGPGWRAFDDRLSDPRTAVDAVREMVDAMFKPGRDEVGVIRRLIRAAYDRVPEDLSDHRHEPDEPASPSQAKAVIDGALRLLERAGSFAGGEWTSDRSLSADETERLATWLSENR